MDRVHCEGLTDIARDSGPLEYRFRPRIRLAAPMLQTNEAGNSNSRLEYRTSTSLTDNRVYTKWFERQREYRVLVGTVHTFWKGVS
jgi:hypothetical protein